MTNIVGQFRKAYISYRLDKLDQDGSKAAALHAVQMQLLHASAAHGMPVKKRDLDLIEEIEKNPHYTQL